MNTVYKFVTNNDDNTDNKPEIKMESYYQICMFPNKDNKFMVRKFTINGKNDFDKVKIYEVSRKLVDKLIKSKKKHQYKLYSTSDIKLVEYPKLADINLLKSDILNNHYNYSGYAPV